MTYIYRIIQFSVVACWCILYSVYFALIVPTRGLARFNRWLMMRPYYWAIVRRRRILGEDEWQERDLHHLGITPPEGHPYWKHLQPCGCPIPVEHDHEVLL